MLELLLNNEFRQTMGFSTIYLRPFYFDRPIEPEHANILNEFSETEHEDESGNSGGEGKPPTYYCQWIPTKDYQGLEWDKNEKFYYPRLGCSAKS
jgi:hypothetical protein